MSPAPGKSGSILVVEEFFSRADPRFLDELRKLDASPKLAGFADRWKKDPRPWAREQIFAYLDLPLDAPGHHPVVKRLFKQAEAARDDALMAAFLVAFDRLIRRVRKRRKRFEWNSVTRETTLVEVEWLQRPRNAIFAQQAPKLAPGTVEPGKHMTVHEQIWPPPSGLLFSYHTRRYLRRRAWRYFRQLGHQRPKDYLPAITRALVLYRDEDLARGENILDSWGLAQACFHHHAALEFKTSSVELRAGHTLAELSPAPYFAEQWKEPPAADALLDLVFQARSRVVRSWAMQLLRQEHSARLDDLTVETLVRLIDHQDDEIQQFGAELLKSSKGASRWPVETWLRLLETRSPTVLANVCEAMRAHVSGSRLDLTQCLKLACAEPVPVARLGFEFLAARSIVSADDRRALAVLGDARCSAMGAELARWALAIVGSAEAYDRDVVTRLFDSLLSEMRQAAWDWLIGVSADRSLTLRVEPLDSESQATRSAGYDDPVLWSRILETPFDDLRLRVIDHLAKRAAPNGRTGLQPVNQEARRVSEGKPSDGSPSLTRRATMLPSSKVAELAPVWCSVLLGVHRGGRQKAKAAAQVAEAIVRSPEQAEQLLPVLSVAVRSVRAPEMRSGLAAVAGLVESRPELLPLVRRHLPELEIAEVGS